jgi:hypothetical protein
MPEFRQYGVEVAKPGTIEVENTGPLGMFLRDIVRDNMTNFRVFGPDENTSNKLDAIYEVSKKFWIAQYFPEDADGGELSVDRSRPPPESCWRPRQGALPKRADCLLQLCLRPRHRQTGDSWVEVAVLTNKLPTAGHGRFEFGRATDTVLF